MTNQHVDPEAVLRGLKDFQRRTSVWAFQRMFDETDPALRFLVADEVGLGKTHIAKGVVAQVIDHLQRTGDERHDIVYVCSNAAIARQNLRKLVPKGIEPISDVERLTMLPLAHLDEGSTGRSGVNLLAITPGTSLNFGQTTGRFEERCLAYAYLRAVWGAEAMAPERARWIFWEGVALETGDQRLRRQEKRYRRAVKRTLPEFETELQVVDRSRWAHHRAPLRDLFDELVDGLSWKRTFPDELKSIRAELISEVRRIMATVGIAALQPDLVVLDEFQRFKDLLKPNPDNFAAELAHRLFNYADPESGRPTRTLLLSATPYRMYTTADELDADHYADFVSTCEFLLQEPERVDRLQRRFTELRGVLTSEATLPAAERLCGEIGAELRSVMARTERLAATPDRDGMLKEIDVKSPIRPDDLRAFVRLGGLAESVSQSEPTEYWKAGPYLFNFMEKYKLKEAFTSAVESGALDGAETLEPGPGLLSWDDLERYEAVDPQNGRLRWLIDDLDGHRAFELLWMPPSLRYYDTGSVYDSDEALSFTKRLIFSGWTVVPKVVSSLVSFEAERRAYEQRDHQYSDDFRSRGGQRLMYRTSRRGEGERRPGESESAQRAAAMTTFLLVWPSPTLAAIGDPRRWLTTSTSASTALSEIQDSVAQALAPLIARAPSEGDVDRRWYWAAPLLLDSGSHEDLVKELLGEGGAGFWELNPGDGLRRHVEEARALVDYGPTALGRPPEDLAEVLSEVALGGPAVCAVRSLGSVTGLGIDDVDVVASAAWVASGFRSYFNGPEATAIVVAGRDAEGGSDVDGVSRYWRDVVRHCISGNIQALLDEHCHVLRDWLGHLHLDTEKRQVDALHDISARIQEAMEIRTSSFRVDFPQPTANGAIEIDEHRMRTRMAVAFATQTLDDGGEARVEAVSSAFNSPFWPFVLTSTSVGQEGLDFHLWCHSVVHWNLPSNPVDLEQREGRVHRYKGHAVRRNIGATLGGGLKLAAGDEPLALWDELFAIAAATANGDSEMVPYWVFPDGPATIERLVPVLPFSRDAAALPRLRKTLAAYRLAFGQPRQEELVEFLGADRSDEELLALASRLRIDLTPPEVTSGI